MSERRPWKGPVPVPAKETLWTPGQKSLVRANYVTSYARATPEERTLGSQFYPQWHEDAQHLGARLSAVSATDPSAAHHEVGAAVMAHLSPSTEAEMNRVQAYQLTHLVETGQREHLLRHLGTATEHSKAAMGLSVSLRHGLQSGTVQRGGDEHHRILGEITQHRTAATQARGRSGVEGTPLGRQVSSSIVNALTAMSHPEPLESLGPVKISDFGRSIADPYGYHRAPVDTHWHDAGLGRTDIDYNVGRGLSSVGRYNTLGHLASQAHAAVSEHPMPTFMAIGWTRHQNLKVAENPNAAKSRKATISIISRMANNKQFEAFMPQTFGMRPPHMRRA